MISTLKHHYGTTSSPNNGHHDRQSHDQHHNGDVRWIKALAGAAGVMGGLWALSKTGIIAEAFKSTDNSLLQSNNKQKKTFSRQEISKHNSLDKGVWITFRGGVYDVTEFIRHHPGGSHTIMMGAGGDVEPFWQTYTVHHAAEVQNLLNSYQIGVLDPSEYAREQEANAKQVQVEDADPYGSDPRRSPLLQVLSQKPFNAETPAEFLPLTYLTPTEIFFVRNHLPVPEVDPDSYTLSVCLGTDGDQDNLKVLAEFTLNDLRTKFKPYSVDSVIQCSGNRRSDLKQIKEIKGLNWKVGAIGNARWTGVRLIDLMHYLNIKSDFCAKNNIRHIQLEGLDCDMSGQTYGASISSDIAFDANKEVLLAYEMNGQALTRDHGFPVRFVAPGVTGARNVKWLGKIILSHEESNSHWQRKDYKSFSPNVDMFNLNFDESISVQETPVQSAICEPQDGDELNVTLESSDVSGDTNFIPVRGYAFSGGGKMVIRVDVSIDGGRNWITANLDDIPKQANGLPDYTRRNQTYSWTRWSAKVPVPIETLKDKRVPLEILCRASDASYNSQPDRPETIWNVRGVMNNSWHRIHVKLNVLK